MKIVLMGVFLGVAILLSSCGHYGMRPHYGNSWESGPGHNAGARQGVVIQGSSMANSVGMR